MQVNKVMRGSVVLSSMLTSVGGTTVMLVILYRYSLLFQNMPISSPIWTLFR